MKKIVTIFIIGILALAASAQQRVVSEVKKSIEGMNLSIENIKSAMNRLKPTLTNDETKDLDANKAAVDAAAALTQLSSDLADQRAADVAAAPEKAFEEYKQTLIAEADNLRKDGDSDAVASLIDQGIAALTNAVYDDTKDLAGNKDALDEIMANCAGAVKDQRRAERLAERDHAPCSLCGQHHTGSMVENMIGIIHGLIWIMRQVALIAA